MSSYLSYLRNCVQDGQETSSQDTMKIPINTDFVDLMQECPRLRVLVIGRNGTGKSTICCRVFHVPYEEVVTSKDAVWNEIRFPRINDSIIFHDSGGFQAGATDCVDEVERFIKNRRNQPRLEDQIHCIWYCISCMDIRPFQPTEIRFFREFDVGKIPVVVVFTQWDILVNQKTGEMDDQYRDDDNMTRRQIRELGTSKAREHYEKKLYNPLLKLIRHSNRVVIQRTELPLNPSAAGGLDQVIEQTREILTSDGLKMLLTSAQRVDADLKLQESLDKGVSVFWQMQGWGAVPLVPGLAVIAQNRAFEKVYQLISRLWNIPTEPLGVFEREDIRHRFYEAASDTSTARRRAANLAQIFDITGPMTAPLSVISLLELIIGVSLICEKLFWAYKENGNRPLAVARILNAVHQFKTSDQRKVALAIISYEPKLKLTFGKDSCVEILRKAIRKSASETHRESQRRETVA